MGRRAAATAAAAALFTLAGCAGDGPPPSGGGSAFDQIQQQIFNPNCLSAGCHNAQSRAGNMNLSPGASYDQLVNVTPDNPVARQEGFLRVEPLRPDNSFILTKLLGPGPGEGSRMPLGQDPLSSADIQMINAWIEAGAPPGSGTEPTFTAIPSVATATATPTPSPTATDTPLPTSTTTATATSTSTPSITLPTPTGTRVATQTSPPSPTSTTTPTSTPSATPTATATPAVSPTATENPNATLAEIQSTIFTPTCLDASCHNSQARSGDLVLEDGASYDNLVGVEPFNFAARSAGLLRVDPGRPDNSLLISKLEGPPVEYGSRMPFDKPPLSAEQIQLIRDWIARGAPP
jgi:hypothetical protein